MENNGYHKVSKLRPRSGGRREEKGAGGTGSGAFYPQYSRVMSFLITQLIRSILALEYPHKVVSAPFIPLIL